MWLAISAGGALGALSRWLVGEVVPGLVIGAAGSGFPWDTLVVNVLGCALIGVLAPVLIGRATWLAGFVVTGFLGGFTTYSAFAEETFVLADRGDMAGLVLAGTYVAVTIAATTLAVILGSRMSPERAQ